MELKIYSPDDAGFVKKIDWNFEELKAEVTAASQEYATSVYTDDMIRRAKEDRAKLRKVSDALKAKRTEIRKELLKPDELFGEQVKELVDIIQRAVDNIDEQVKGYEQRQRDEKTAKIREFYEEEIRDLAEYLPFERVFRPEYANASTTMKSIKAEISGMIQKVSEGLAILNEVDSPYAADMKKVFLRTYDIGVAMAERNRLEAEEQNRKAYMEEMERRRAEKEAQRRAEAERIMAAGAARSQEQPEAEAVRPAVEKVEEPVHVVDFRVKATKHQLDLLKSFLKYNGISYGPVPKE